MPRRDKERKELEERRRLFELEGEEMDEIFAALDEPINVAETVRDMTEEFGNGAAIAARDLARYHDMRGNKDVASDWRDVQSAIESQSK